MKNWETIENLIRQDILDIHRATKDLAPQNSKYTGMRNYLLVPYILVDGSPIYTNTNNLYESVELKFENIGGRDIVATTFVSNGNVPYYERAVLKPTIPIIYYKGTIDYGEAKQDSEYYDEVENINYMYYMRAKGMVENKIRAWDGQRFNITDRLEDFL